MAGVKTMTTSGNFNVGTNWSPSGVPGAGDRIVIPSTKTCTVTADATVDTMDVEGTLDIEPGVTLTLENDNHNDCPGGGTPGHQCGPDDSEVSGAVQLFLDDDEGGVLFFDAEDHVVSGTGSIWGQSADHCFIQIEGDLVLTNQLATALKGIRGSLTIDGLSGSTDGMLINEGIVEAESIIVVNAVIDDIEGALWITGCKDTMHFKQGSTDLEGDFTEDDNDFLGGPGTFRFDLDIKTCGAYRRSGGAIDVATDVVFQFVEFEDLTGIGGSCGNPGTPLNNPPNCSLPYEVDADVAACVMCG